MWLRTSRGLSPRASATSRFKTTGRGRSWASQLVFSQYGVLKKKLSEQRERERERTHLLTENQLVIKEEEDSLLAASVGLIDPWQLPGVDELRAPVQDIIPLDTQTNTRTRTVCKCQRIGTTMHWDARAKRNSTRERSVYSSWSLASWKASGFSSHSSHCSAGPTRAWLLAYAGHSNTALLISLK